MRAVLLLLPAFLALSGLASASEVVVVPSGDASASVLAVSGQGNAFCGGTQCVAAAVLGNAACYGPFCAALAVQGNAFCQALVCVAGSVFGDSYALGRFSNTQDEVVAVSVFGNATSDRTRGNQEDYAVSGTGDARSDTYAVSLTGRAYATSSNGLALSGCNEVEQLCLDPA